MKGSCFRIWLIQLIMILALFDLGKANASDAIQNMLTERNGDFVAITFKFNQVMTPRDVQDTIRDAARNPFVVSVLSGVLSSAGVPTVWTKVALKIAASQQGGPRDETRHYVLDFPSNWAFCRAKYSTVSIVPNSGERASELSVRFETNRLAMTAWTPRLRGGKGRSWIEADFTVILIRAAARAQHVSDGTCKPARAIPKCKGYGCKKHPEI